MKSLVERKRVCALRNTSSDRIITAPRRLVEDMEDAVTCITDFEEEILRRICGGNAASIALQQHS